MVNLHNCPFNVLPHLMLFHPEEDEEEDEDDELLRRTGDLVASSDRLPSGVLRVSSRRRAPSNQSPVM